MMKSLIALVATAALAVELTRRLSNRHRLRHARRERQRHREEVSRWEAEGGNLPPGRP